jgi:polysaccharide pyruvyl transferase WcaK-like protein
MTKPKVGLVGYFGWGNFGDELFIKAHRQHLTDLVELQVVHDMLEAPYFSREALDRISSFDGFLIGGGDLVNPRAFSTLYWREEYLRKPVFVHSIGCPSLQIQQSPSILKFRTFFGSPSIKHVNLRDIESKNYFDSVIRSACETTHCPDAVFALNMPASSKPQDRVLGVVLRQHKSLEDDTYPDVRHAIHEAKSLGYKVRLIVAATGTLGSADYELTKSFAREDETIVYCEDLDDICAAIGSCSLVLSMKFHVVVVGALYGVPVIQLSSTQKNSNLFRLMQRPDLRRNHVDNNLWRAIPPTPAPIHTVLIQRLKRSAYAGYEQLRASISATFSV